MGYSVLNRSIDLLRCFKMHHRLLKSPRQLILYVSDRCNLKCGHCFWLSRPRVGELSLDEIKKIASKIKDPLLYLSITGGEPFLRNDLVEVCEAFVRENGTRAIHINTNGTPTDKVLSTAESILRKCNHTEFILQVSIDGMEETHEKIRGVKGCFAAACKTLVGLKNLQKRYKNLKRVDAITVISNQNSDEIQELLDLSLKKLGVFHCFEPLRGTRFLKQKGLEEHNPANQNFAVASNLESVYHQIKKAGKKALANPSIPYQIQILKYQKKIVKCLAGNYISVIYSNGDVALCEMTKPIGNLRDVNYDFQEVWFSQKAKKRRREIRNCFCTHGVFIYPSLKYSIKHSILHALRRLKNA